MQLPTSLLVSAHSLLRACRRGIRGRLLPCSSDVVGGRASVRRRGTVASRRAVACLGERWCGRERRCSRGTSAGDPFGDGLGPARPAAPSVRCARGCERACRQRDQLHVFSAAQLLLVALSAEDRRVRVRACECRDVPPGSLTATEAVRLAYMTRTRCRHAVDAAAVWSLLTSLPA